MAGAGALLVIALFCFVGPFLTPGDYDKVYPDYVRAPPSFCPHPTEPEARDALTRIASRMRARVAGSSLESDRVEATLQADRSIDARGLVYFERSDVFGAAQIVERSDDGRTLGSSQRRAAPGCPRAPTAMAAIC